MISYNRFLEYALGFVDHALITSHAGIAIKQKFNNNMILCAYGIIGMAV